MDNCILLKDFNFCINEDELSKNLSSNEEENCIVKKLIEEAKKIATPKAIFKECFISDRGDDFVVLDSLIFNSRIISVNLCGENKAFPYIVTCGTELKNWSNSKKDKFEKKTAEAITQEILIQCHSLLKNHIEKNFDTGNLARVNPGSTIDWELKEQQNIFNILKDKVDSIGVTLDINFFMTPDKTYSGIYFHNETGYKNCYMCPATECPLRETDYDKNYYNEHYNTKSIQS